MNSKVTIGINGSMLDDHPTGVGIYTANLINHLSLLYNTPQTGLKIYTPTRSSLLRHLSIVKLPGLLKSSRYGRVAAASRFLWNILVYPLQSHQCRVLLSPTTHGSLLAKNQILTIHDLISLHYNNISRHQRFYFRYILPRLLARSKMIIAISETTKNDIVHFFKCPPQKIQVVYNGIDHARYFVTDDVRRPIDDAYNVRDYFLTVGPTYAHKNFERLLEAYSTLPDEIKKAHPLVIAGGKQPYVDTLKEYVKKRGLQQAVHFLGYVPDGLMPALYREAKALLFPSLHEGFGFPLVEAMACGCPVAASRTSSMPEVCGEAALYFDPLHVPSIRHAMEALASDPALVLSLRQKGLVQCQQFSWTRTAATLKALIDTQIEPT